METRISTAPGGGRPPYFEARRRGIANVLVSHGIAQAADGVIEAGSWAIVPGAGDGNLKEALYARGFGCIDGRIGFWADTPCRTVDGREVTIGDDVLVVPGIARDEAAGISHHLGRESVVYGSAGRYTTIDTTVRHSGHDSGWADVRVAFPRITRWASPPVQVRTPERQWRFASPKRRIGRAYEYLFCPPSDSSHRQPPTHFFFAGFDVQHRRKFGLDPWAYSTPPLLANNDAWLPLTAT